MTVETKRSAAVSAAQGTAVAVLAAISVCHMLNDVIQSLIMAIYPMLKENLALNFHQIGLITFTFQFTASVLQPVVGYFTDRYPTPYSLVIGMGSSLVGLILIAFATSYLFVLAAAALIGMGSSVFHPESSRVARLASGGRHGLAQSVFQVGGNFGTALGPLFAAFIVLPYGQHTIIWFSLVALIGMVLLAIIGTWYGKTLKLKRVSEWLGDKQWLEGDRFTIGDLVMTTTLRFLRHTNLVAETPGLGDYLKRAEARPAFQKALADQLATFAANQPQPEPEGAVA